MYFKEDESEVGPVCLTKFTSAKFVLKLAQDKSGPNAKQW